MSNEKIKIVHISDINFESISGIATVIPKLIESQNHTGECEAMLLTLRKETVKYNFPIYNISSATDFFRIILKLRPNLIVFHDLYSLNYLVLSFILILLRLPYIVVPHSCLTKEAQKKKMIKKFIANYTLWFPMILFAKGLIFLNENEKNNSIFKWKKNEIIPNGIDKINYFPKNHIYNEIINIIFLGRFDIHHKGLDRLLEAIAKIKNELISRKVTLHLYGFATKRGKHMINDEMRIKQMIMNFSLDKIVILHGPIKGDEKNNIINNSDIMILTSRYEGMPMSVLEAFSFGVPVIISKETTLGDIVIEDQSGWLLSKNVENWPKEIISFIDEYKSKKSFYINNAYKSASKFLWSKIGQESVQKYKQFI